MSKTLVLEISDEVYTDVQKRVKQKGSTTEIFVIESIVKNLSNMDEKENDVNPAASRDELMRFAGVADSGDSRSGDNDKIDENLAREYGKDM